MSSMHTPGAKVAENHQNVRAAERFDLEVKVDLESDHNFYTGLTQNISSGGLFIATHHLRRIGDRITLKFTLPGSDKTLDVETEVRWIRENTALMRAEGGTGMGVRFINLSPETSAAINAFVQARESLYYDDED
jgi:molecular chaperone DnaK